jgi:serine/threonine protein kinase
LDRIGRYKIIAKIGQGGTSHVYKGHDATLDRMVAVKTISADAAEDPTLKKRFEREARSAAGLNHPHIITVFDFGQEGDKLYIAMEFLDGEDLKDAIAAGRFSDLEAKLDAMDQICEGLAFAHANQVIHRDLKPANIHILPDGQVKIMDFGLARTSGSDMTRTGLVMGTPHYMSPEQVRGEHVDFRSDVFALGAVFYEILTGKKPFDAESFHSVFYKVMQAEPKPAKDLVPGLPLVLQQILEKAMAKAPAQRFADAGEMGEFLGRAREAITEGRGNEPLAGLVPPSAIPAGTKAPEPRRVDPPAPGPPAQAGSPSASRPEGSHHAGPGGRKGERSGSASRSRSQTRLTPARSGTALYLAGLAVLVVVVLGIVFAMWPSRGSDAGNGGGKIDLVMKDVARKKAELARNRLEAGDYEDALERALDALNYDPEQAVAKEVSTEARKIKDRVEKAIAGARPQAGRSPGVPEQAAYWDLLQVAPERAEARDLAASHEAGLKSRAEEARRLMDEVQKAATETRASELEDFKTGKRLAGEAEVAFKDARFASAARDFMRARDRFRRAQAVASGTAR